MFSMVRRAFFNHVALLISHLVSQTTCALLNLSCFLYSCDKVLGLNPPAAKEVRHPTLELQAEAHLHQVKPRETFFFFFFSFLLVPLTRRIVARNSGETFQRRSISKAGKLYQWNLANFGKRKPCAVLEEQSADA